MRDFVKIIKAVVSEFTSDQPEEQELACQMLQLLTNAEREVAEMKSETKKRKQKSSWQPAKQKSVKDALLELGDGATDEQMVEDIRMRQGSSELSKDQTTAITQVHARVSGMRYVRKHRGGGWELVGAIRNQIRKPHVVA